MNVLAFTKYDREAASTRQRLLQFIPTLADAGIEVEYRPLFNNDYVRSLTGHAKASRLAIGLAYFRRIGEVLRRPDADLLWIYAELFPWLPGVFERLAHLHGIPVVYDLDDAFFVPYKYHRNRVIRHLFSEKLRPLIEGAAACTCGNDYLREYAANWCEHSIVVPTVVDTDRYKPATTIPTPLVIGWIGSPSTWANVRPLLPILEKIHRETGAIIRAVGAGRDAKRDQFNGLELRDWSEATEITQVQEFSIGIMPLLDEPFQRGKSGYKLVQYMACGLPTIASPVGVNCQIVDHERTGLLASTPLEWDQGLRRLLSDGALRESFGQGGRAKVVERYSLASQAPRLVSLFESLV